MVYRLPAEQVRHATGRCGSAATGTDEVVESHRIALLALRRVPVLHRRRPVRSTPCSRRSDDRPAFEQPGCLHAGMDLYKHAYRLLPAGALASWSPTASSWPATSGCSTCAPRRTTCPGWATPRSGWRPPRASRSTSRPSATSPSAAPAAAPAARRRRAGPGSCSWSRRRQRQAPQRGPAVGAGAGLAGDLAGLDAGGADVELLGGGLAHHRAHGLDVRVPAALGPPVRVRDGVAEAGPLPQTSQLAATVVVLTVEIGCRRSTAGADAARTAGQPHRLQEAARTPKPARRPRRTLRSP